jgi:hypothetical protein
MSVTLVSGSAGSQTSSSGADITYLVPIAIQAGDCLVFIGRAGPAGSSAPWFSISDSASNPNWTLAVSAPAASNTTTLEMWFCWNAAAASANIVTITAVQTNFTSFTGGGIFFILRGCNSATSPLDTGGTGPESLTGYSPQSQSMTPGTSGLAISGWYEAVGPTGAASGWTLINNNAGFDFNAQYIATIGGSAVTATGQPNSGAFDVVTIVVANFLPPPASTNPNPYANAVWFDQ